MVKRSIFLNCKADVMAPVARAAAVVCRLCLPQIQNKQYNYIVDKVTELRLLWCVAYVCPRYKINNI